MQTAYSAILQARDLNAEFVFLQSSKLLRETDQPYKAIQDIDNALKSKIPANIASKEWADDPNNPVVSPDGLPTPLAKVRSVVRLHAADREADLRLGRPHFVVLGGCMSPVVSSTTTSFELIWRPANLHRGELYIDDCPDPAIEPMCSRRCRRWESPHYYLGRYWDARTEDLATRHQTPTTL